MQVNGAKATSHQNVSPGADTKVGISPPEVTLTPKRALSCLSLSPTFHLEVYRSPSVKECRDGVLCKGRLSCYITTTYHNEANFSGQKGQIRGRVKCFTSLNCACLCGKTTRSHSISWLQRLSGFRDIFGWKLSERYSQEGIVGIMPSNVLVRNILTLSLQTFIAALEVSNLDQVNRLCRATNLTLDVGRATGLDISEFRTIFNSIYLIVDAWFEASTTDAVSIFNHGIKEKMAEIKKRLEEIAADEIEQLGVVA